MDTKTKSQQIFETLLLDTDLVTTSLKLFEVLVLRNIVSRACTEYLAITIVYALKLFEDHLYSMDFANLHFFFSYEKLEGKRFTSDGELLRTWNNKCETFG